MTRETMKPFCKVVELLSGASGTYNLTQTSGTGSVDATYVSVEVVSGDTGEGYFHVIPSGVTEKYLYLSATADPEGDRLGHDNGAAGHVGGSLSVVSFSFKYTDRQNSITIINKFAESIGFGINYGTIQSASEVRDSSITIGK